MGQTLETGSLKRENSYCHLKNFHWISVVIAKEKNCKKKRSSYVPWKFIPSAYFHFGTPSMYVFMHVFTRENNEGIILILNY